MPLRLLLALSLLWISSASAFASDGARKVTRYEYDGLGRTVVTKVFDDRSDGRHLMSESTTQYDVLHNVTREVVKRVNFDQDGNGSVEPVINGYGHVETRRAYEDNNWPTRATHVYSPRWAHLDAAEQKRRAAQTWYDKDTGQVELSINSGAYCTDFQHSHANFTKISETFLVDRGDQVDIPIGIQSYNRCLALYSVYDEHGRVKTSAQLSGPVPWPEPGL